MNRLALIVLVFSMSLAPARGAFADEPSVGGMERVMDLWCMQTGTWTGMIDVTASGGKAERMELVTTHDCTEASEFHIVRERFGSAVSTVKVTYIDRTTREFHTSYFSGSQELPYRFSFVSVEAIDDTHWKTIIASPPGTEQYEGRPATLRYIRVRNGDSVESWKDVQFADGNHDFEPRSRIVQTLRR